MAEIEAKVKYFHEDEIVIRRLLINKNIKLDELFDTLRTRFMISPNDEILLYYRDGENDLVVITYEDELRLSLSPCCTSITYELVNIEQKETINNKPVSNIKAKIKYPDEQLGSGVGDCYEVVFESKYLIEESKKKGTNVWGTDIYTGDSDYLKALFHSQSIKVVSTPPPYDIIATFKVVPGRTSYVGSDANGIKSLSYGNWGSSFTIEKYRYSE